MRKVEPRNQAGSLERTFLKQAFLVLLLVSAVPALYGQRTVLRPGMNIFSPADDVQYGRMVAQDAERKLPMLNDPRVDDYLNRLGKRLAAKAPGEDFPYQFKCVNDPSINAFALPGGFLYIHRGVIEAAENEAQLAGVIGHEIGHVALRHGTNQATKAYIAQVPLAIFGGMVGSNSLGAVMARLGAEFTAGSFLLKFSRDAERQADIIGTQILFDSEYDARAMAQFFEKLQAENKRGRAVEFFSSHPNPENRMQNVMEEIRKLGGESGGHPQSETNEFIEIQRYVRSLPAPSGTRSGTSGVGPAPASRPDPPSGQYADYATDSFRLRHPDNWKVFAQGTAVTLSPEGGIVENGSGTSALAYGIIIAIFDPSQGQAGTPTLEQATDRLIQTLRVSNPQIQVTRPPARTKLSGQRALSALLHNESPTGGVEYDWLVTVLRPEGLLYFVCVVPEPEFDGYRQAFRDVLNSVRLQTR